MWPDDGEPRFIVTSVSGYRIDPASSGRGNQKPSLPVSYQVVDRAYAHKLVREFPASDGASQQSIQSLVRLQRAADPAAELNAQDVLGLLDEDAA